MTRRKLGMLLVGVLAVSAVIATAASADNQSGFKTGQPSMLTEVMSDAKATALLTVGDVLPSGFRFEAIPDGISVRTRGQGRVDLYVNHETSKVPFPFNTAAPTAANGENDFDNAQVARLILNQHSAGVLNGSFVIPSKMGYQRFCSNYLATSKEGFARDILFTNEESPDYALRQEASWPPQIGDPNEKEAGLVVALDVQTGKYHAIPGMGRHNHENNVALPGFEDLVVLSGDDTFTSGPLTGPPSNFTLPPGLTAPAQSQLYSYIASDTDSLLADDGDLWAFVADNPSPEVTIDDYYDFTPGSSLSVSGRFIQVPKNIATGLDDDGSELKAADLDYPLPPTSPNWQTDLRTTGTSAVGIDGPQWVLEYWSQLNHVFDFIRVEDIAYDKRADMENVVYVVDSGRGSSGQGMGISTNGRVWKMVFDRNDPTVVTSLSVFVEGDDSVVKTANEVHQPDNIESTPKGLLLTEDPGSSQQFTAAQQVSDAARATTARLWFVPFSGTPDIVVRVNQSADGGPTDVGPAPTGNLSIGNWGAWETSGIVDASAAFGRGAYLIDVQAHTLWIESRPGEDTFIDANTDPDFTYKREGGQLLLLRLPVDVVG